MKNVKMGSASSLPKTEKLTRKQKRLLREADKTVSLFSLAGRCFDAKIVDVHDGDTVTVAMFVNGQLNTYQCRLSGIDAPELRPRRDVVGRDVIIANAQASRDYLSSLVPEDRMVVVKVSDEKEKYGRLLVTLYSRTQQQDLNTMMLESGHAQKYNGGTKDPYNGLAE